MKRRAEMKVTFIIEVDVNDKEDSATVKIMCDHHPIPMVAAMSADKAIELLAEGAKTSTTLQWARNEHSVSAGQRRRSKQ
jgi:hypothetical protein